MADEPIGSVSVQITGDYSSLEKSLNDAQGIAQQAGQKIADGLTSGAAGATELTTSVSGLGSAVDDLANKSGLAGGELNIFRAALQGSLDAGVPVAEALKDISASGTTLGTSVAAAADALSRESVAAAAATTANVEVAGSFKTVGASVESTDAAFKEFADGVQNFISHPLRSAGEAAKEFILAIGPMGVVAMAGATAVAAIAAETFNLVKAFGQTTEATQNMADRLNLSWHETRQLEEMAQIAGVSIGTLQQASFRLAESLDADSTNGQKVAEALAKVGVTGATSGELLSNFLQKLAEIPDDTQRIALAHEVLGRSSQQILPLIKNYAELQEAVQHLGPQIDENLSKKLLASDDALDKLSLSWTRLKERLAAFAAPGVESFVNLLTALITGDTMPTIDKQIADIEAKMVSLGEKSALAGWLLADGLTKGKDATLKELQAQRDLLVGQEAARERSKEYNAEIAASNAAAAAASRAAKAAALEQYNAMVDFNNSVVELWNSIPDTYDKYVGNLTEGGKTAKSMMDALTADINRGNTAMIGLSGAPLASVQKTVAELMTARDQVKGWAEEDSWNKLAVHMAGLAEKFGPQVEKILAAGGPVAERMADLMNAAPNVPDAFQPKDEKTFLDEIVKVQKQIDDDSQKTGTHMQEMWEKYRGGAAKAQEATVPITALIHDRLPEAFVKTYDESMHLNESLRILGLTGVSAAGAVQYKWMAAFDDFATHANKLSEVDILWDAYGNKIDRLAKYNLPEAIRMQQEYIDALERTDAPLAQIYDAQEKILNQEIRNNTQRGKDATEYIVALEIMRLRTDALYSSTRLFGDLIVSLHKNYDQLFNAFSAGVAHSILKGGEFWKFWHDIWQKFEQDVMTLVVHTALKTLANTLLETLGLGKQLAVVLDRIGLVKIPGLRLPEKMGPPDASTAASETGLAASVDANTAATTGDTTATSADTAATSADTTATLADVGVTALDTASTAVNTAFTALNTGAISVHTGTMVTSTISYGVSANANTIATAANTLAVGANTIAAGALTAAVGADAGVNAAGAGINAAGGAAKGIGGAIGGIAGGTVGGVVNMVSGVVSAISSVVGNFQMAKMETTLNAIEESTRYLKIGLVTQGDSLLNDGHTIRNILTDMGKWNQNVVQTYLQNINIDLDTLVGLGRATPGTTPAVAKITADAVAMSPSPVGGGSGDINVSIDTVEAGVSDAKVTEIFNRGIRKAKLAGAFPAGRFPQ